MNNIERIQSDEVQVVRGAPGQRGLARQVSRNLARLEAETILRLANAQAEGMVAREKVRQIDHLAREAMTGQAMLAAAAGAVAADNPLLYEEACYFRTIGRLGKGQIIAELLDDFCDENGRRR